MNSEIILKSDVLDILFEKRNKMYGAYALRKFYNNRLIKSIAITVGAASILSAFTFMPNRKGTIIFYDAITMANLPKPKTPEPKKELPKHTAKPAAALAQKIFTKPLIVAVTQKVDTLQIIKPTDAIGALNIIAKANTDAAIIGTPTNGEGDGGKAIVSTPPKDINEPINNPDVAPAYPGGINALRKFLERNLKNPTDMEPGEMVSVSIRFVVGYDGKLQKFTTEQDGDERYNNEVIRVMKKMPQWIPGKANGENVAVYFSIPVKFVPAD